MALQKPDDGFQRTEYERRKYKHMAHVLHHLGYEC